MNLVHICLQYKLACSVEVVQAMNHVILLFQNLLDLDVNYQPIQRKQQTVQIIQSSSPPHLFTASTHLNDDLDGCADDVLLSALSQLEHNGAKACGTEKKYTDPGAHGAQYTDTEEYYTGETYVSKHLQNVSQNLTEPNDILRFNTNATEEGSLSQDDLQRSFSGFDSEKCTVKKVLLSKQEKGSRQRREGRRGVGSSGSSVNEQTRSSVPQSTSSSHDFTPERSRVEAPSLTSSLKRKRKFPGPAGVLPKLVC